MDDLSGIKLEEVTWALSEALPVILEGEQVRLSAIEEPPALVCKRA